MSRVRIKFCGLTRGVDVEAALEAGADAIGLNCARGPRRIGLDQARELAFLVVPPALSVLLLMDPDETSALEAMRATRCQALQLHGAESADLVARLRQRFPVIKACAPSGAGELLALADHPADLLLFDSPGGGGSGHGWDVGLLADGFPRPYLLAGGLRPETVAQTIARLRPWGVDVSSGIESSPGIKDAGRMQAFAAAVRSQD